MYPRSADTARRRVLRSDRSRSGHRTRSESRPAGEPPLQAVPARRRCPATGSCRSRNFPSADGRPRRIGYRPPKRRGSRSAPGFPSAWPLRRVRPGRAPKPQASSRGFRGRSARSPQRAGPPPTGCRLARCRPLAPARESIAAGLARPRSRRGSGGGGRRRRRGHLCRTSSGRAAGVCRRTGPVRGRRGTACPIWRRCFPGGASGARPARSGPAAR